MSQVLPSSTNQNSNAPSNSVRMSESGKSRKLVNLGFRLAGEVSYAWLGRGSLTTTRRFLCVNKAGLKGQRWFIMLQGAFVSGAGGEA